MKKLVLILAFFWVQISFAQIVNIPDANFKATVIGYDTNNNGEIDVSEAQSITYLDIRYKEIVSLEGIQHFSNLIHLDCSYNDINFIDVSGLNNLKYLNCYVNEINSLPLNSLENLEYLNFGVNPITSIGLSDVNNLIELRTNGNLTSLDISNLSKLETIFSYSHLQAIDLTNLTNLKNISLVDAQITSLNLSHLQELENFYMIAGNLNSLILSGLTNLESINCSDNNISNLELSNLPNLKTLHVGDNPLSNLDVSSFTELTLLSCPNTLISSLDISSLTKLKNLYCQNNELTSLNVLNQSELTDFICRNNQLTSLDLSNQSKLSLLLCESNPLEILNIKNGVIDGNISLPHASLLYVCVDSEEREEVEDLVNSNCVVNSFCTFIPGGDVYHIEGNVKVDIDQDGCDSGDLGFPFMQIKVEDTNGNLGIFSTELDGSYNIALPEGSYTVIYQFPYMSYFDITPATFTVNFPSDTSPFLQDICLTPNGTYNDLQVAIIPIEQARPGFDTDYKIVYANVGTTVLSGDVIFTFEDDVVDFVSASVTPDSQSTGQLSWSFSNLVPFEVKVIDVTMNLNTPTETPPLNGGDILCYEATISPMTNDEIPNDNSFSLKQTVVNSYDPNDKTCLEGDVITPDLVGEYVHYLIRFENTGSASAVNIVVKDVIDTDKFDIETFVPMNSSHDFVTRIQNNNEVEFIFENVNLPFDDANNDGFVMFKIKTLSSLVVGDTFENGAEIYFDFNFPIITNIEQTTVDVTASTDDFTLNSNISVFPNPANDQLQIESKLDFDTIIIYDLTGKEIKRIVSTQNRLTQDIDVSNLKSGIYYISIQSGNSKITEKFLKS